jgi:hypothetical protein
LHWLLDHPERTYEWLLERLKDGFHIHHLDGNHSNNEPTNLVLIEASDHFRLHGGRLKYLKRDKKPYKKPPPNLRVSKRLLAKRLKYPRA